MIEFAFVVVAVLGSLYFLLAKRVFDWNSAAFFSAVVYFLPGFVGYTGGERFKGSLASTPLAPEAMAVMVTVLLAILLSAILSDRNSRSAGSRPLNLRGVQLLPQVLLAFAAIGCVMTFVTAGAGLLSTNKLVQFASYKGRWFLVWQTGCILATVVAFSARRWITFALSVVLCLVTMFMAIRMCAALATIGVIVYKLSSLGRRRLIRKGNWKFAVGIALFCLVMFGYKGVSRHVKARDFESVGAAVSAPQYIEEALLNSEPFGTQHVLNVVIRSRFRVGLRHFSECLWAALVNPLTKKGGRDTIRVSFNDKFQHVLMGDVSGGMASNVWAELWSGGGWFLFLVGLGLFVYVNRRASRLMLRSSPSLGGILASVSGFWVFYIHRNDFYRMLSFAKQIGLLLIVSIAVAKVLQALLIRSLKKKGGRRRRLAPAPSPTDREQCEPS